MESVTVSDHKPHLICVPAPTQSHIKAMLGLAKLLHHKGFRVTFVNTEFNHNRLLRSSATSLDLLSDDFPDFRFEAIPDGLPPSDPNATQDVAQLINAVDNNLLSPFRQLVAKLNKVDSPVTSIVADGFNEYGLTVAKEFGIPVALFYTVSACAFMAFKELRTLISKGILPLKEDCYLTPGYVDTMVDLIPGMKNMRLRDLPVDLRTTDVDDYLLNFCICGPERASKASAVVFHTFDALEQDVLEAISSMIPRIYTIGPLPLLLNQIPNDPLKSIGSSLWKEEDRCFQWLNSKATNSVLYVSFGSIAVLAPEQLAEFAWGLANSKHSFLWIIRPDLVTGDSAILPSEFVDETKDRSLIVSWCLQEEVLSHPSVGGFLTHNGWGSTIESISAGVPMLCRPFFTDQLTNCKYCCDDWRIGMEIGNDVKRGEVEKLVRNLMEGEKGVEMRKNVEELKRLAEEATSTHGSATLNLDKLINDVLLSQQG